MNGYLDKQSGDAEKKNLSWLRKYVEVSEGTLRYFNSREERDESGIVVPLADTFVSIQNKRNIRLENRNGVRIFRANCELRAQTWGFVLAQYCIVAPMGEGFCKKLSGGKDNVWEERYVRLAADGILSWHKNDEGEARGAIQVRGEGVSIVKDNPCILIVATKDRKYKFEFIDKPEAMLWFGAITWHSHRTPLSNPTVNIRNKRSF
ncbi:uncharacterized protein LOC143464577 isoform X3 [Clavelina lepadiformis]|uniref:PH domain-containing protein n=1 Tax=Clavelina lepadiformis TaxID=159417 RepID=A0ABP0F2N8_CLALP